MEARGFARYILRASAKPKRADLREAQSARWFQFRRTLNVLMARLACRRSDRKRTRSIVDASGTRQPHRQRAHATTPVCL